MFCSKCGYYISDEAEFCNKCGNRVNQEENKGPVNEIVNNASAKPLLNPTLLIAVVLAVVALILTFLPWVEISDPMRSIDEINHGNGGMNIGDYDAPIWLDESYSLWSINGCANAEIGFIIEYPEVRDDPELVILAIRIFGWISVISCALSVVFTISGCAVYFLKHKLWVFRIGCIALIATIAAFYGLRSMGTDMLQMTIYPTIFSVFAVSAFVFSLLSTNVKKKKC